MKCPRGLSRPLLAVCLAALCGCAAAKEIRIQNVSTLDFTEVSIAGERYGDIAAGEASGYRRVPTRLGYAVLRLTADGHRVTGQTLNLGSRRFTDRIDVADLAAGHLAIEVVRDP